ncbi:DUF885 domain-containing protein [Woodsholea maritima]|uniref:DUF885 domain-containing protein n=1 Tax=Woodsholea maritima TaxID=240237 RepID=UPI0003A627B1|nr:DUF885 family protein [Woodsholea maritima]
MRNQILTLSASLMALTMPFNSAEATPGEDFQILVEDYEDFRDNFGGGDDEDDVSDGRYWPEETPETAARYNEAVSTLYDRLKAINPRALEGQDVASYAVMDYLLKSEVAMAAFDINRISFRNDSGFHTGPSFYAIQTRIRTVAEGEEYIARLKDIPRYFEKQTAWLQLAMDTGWTQPRAILDGVANQIDAQIVEDPEASGLMAPFTSMSAHINEAERERLYQEGLSAVRDDALPAFRALSEFFHHQYMPAARETLGARAMPQGEDFYRALVRYHTTLDDATPESVHETGLQEVARIRAEMDEVIAASGFEGSFQDFIAFLRTDPQFYATSERELLMHASYLAKKVDDQMPAFFGTLPRLSYGVRAVPADIAPTYTTGRYWPGNYQEGRAGGYMVNTYALDQRPLYTLPALTLHEGVPGHHHQGAIAAEIDNVPDFRRQTYITAFGEGWGLYSEFLGQDMGLYETPYEEFGRLTYEMWRACRLVADTGIHWYGWSQDQAEACFLENSALSPLNIRNEVSRYISWPGQALAYKTGEIVMRRLRTQAEAELGEDFDIRAFHDALLEDGALPMSALETKMQRWITDQKTQIANDNDD